MINQISYKISRIGTQDWPFGSQTYFLHIFLIKYGILNTVQSAFENLHQFAFRNSDQIKLFWT